MTNDPLYRENFDFCIERLVTAQGAAREFHNARIEGGFDVFVERSRNERIARFEAVSKDSSLFEVRVLKWLRPGEATKTTTERPALSIGMVDPHSWYNEGGDWYYDWTKVVPVETETTIPVGQRFAKMPKKSQRDLLGLVCDKMIERQAWDEIAVLLTNYLEGDAPLVLKLLGGQR